MIRLRRLFFFFSSRRRHTRCSRDWSSDVCSSDLALTLPLYKLVEPTLLQQLVQPLVERMCHRPRPLRVGNPKLFLRLPLLRSSSHRHARSLRTSTLDYARNFTSESRLSPRTARASVIHPNASR